MKANPLKMFHLQFQKKKKKKKMFDVIILKSGLNDGWCVVGAKWR